ncbi:MAG: hypothetical protein ACKON8_07860, partial [Planctomycetota bacterium]
MWATAPDDELMALAAAG